MDLASNTDPAQWLAQGAVLYLLPLDGAPLGADTDAYRTLAAEELDALPLIHALHERLPPTHALNWVKWTDGVGILYARRSTLPPVSAQWLREQHAEARLRYVERAPVRPQLRLVS
jgi:hypothetical protein